MTGIRNFFAWVYNWITVIAGTVTGALVFLPDLITNLLSFTDAIGLGVVDLTAIGINPLTAAKITTIVALVKGVHAWYMSRRAA